jgi:N-6 DNA Methylase
MAASFQSTAQEETFNAVISELEEIGYKGELLEKDYRFPDYFKDGTPERIIPAAAFGQTPTSYKTACFGVLLADRNGQQGLPLIESYRSLGAPFHFEVREGHVNRWAVGRNDETTRVEAEYSKSQLRQAFKQHANLWSPESILRAKSIGLPRGERQLDFFDAGLIPALEEQIEKKLDPILKDALAAAKSTYKITASSALDERELFRLAFRLLAGKIFHDRGVRGFRSLSTEAGPDAVLQQVANHYRESVPLLLNLQTRRAAFEKIWSGLDFRNLSIDVLTAIWSKTLVTKRTRRALGIHTTPRTIANYLVGNLPSENFERLRENGGVVVEPFCGSATFLVEAMQRIRGQLLHMSPQERHAYFQSVLAGFEVETFGVEIARLCLTLADFPNPNGWHIYEENVFTSPNLPATLKAARVVLCNPPFRTLAPNDPSRADVESPHQPAEALRRVLLDLHPDGVLGFVLPRKFLDSARYREERKALVFRFADIELVSLPDVAFRDSEAQHETVLLLATGPRQNGEVSNVRHRRVTKNDWSRFSKLHQPTTDDFSVKTADEAAHSLAVPLLGDVWSYLEHLPKLGDVAKTSRGVEWQLPLVKDGEETGNRQKYVFDSPQSFTREGVPPLAKILAFQEPETKHLSMKPEDQRRNAYKRPWHAPKVVLNASRRSRGPWRISAFADLRGLTCYRTFLAVWPHEPGLTTVFAAILNGPVANAFSTTREGFNITQKSLKTFPVPQVSESLRRNVENEVAKYVAAAVAQDWESADSALRWIDAFVLGAYDLPPRLERKLLDYFRGATRAVPFAFNDYFPPDLRPYFSLADFLSKEFNQSTAKGFRARRNIANPDLLHALRVAARIEARDE